MAEEKPNCCPPRDRPAAESSCCPPASKRSTGSDCSPPPGVPQTECCPPTKGQDEPCCDPAAASAELPGYSINPFVCGWLSSPVGQVPQVTSRLDWNDRRGRWAMRWGIGRDRYRITPGLYAVGRPDADAPVLVSANYKLSFDCLRSALTGIDAWLLVIDTKGINVWCAAGKGTFGTDEIVRRCRLTELDRLVQHRRLVVPQLGAPGVAAHLVKQQTGFNVVYGPVRAADLPEFLAAGMQASAEMRRVKFTTWERTILTPVELTVLRKPLLLSMLALFLLSGIGANIFSFSAAWHRGLAAILAGLTGVIAGCVVTPILLPWLPGRAFAGKGALMGVIAATVLALGPYRQAGPLGLISLYLFVCAIASYMAMNFTGSSTFTSPSGVEKEMRLAIPCQAGALLVSGLLWIGAAF